MQKTKGIVLAIFSSATFGLIAFFSIPLMRAGVGPSSVLFYRSLLAAIMLGMACLLMKKNLKVSGKIILELLGLGVLYTLTSFGLIYSYQYISSGVATTIHFLYPIMVVVLMSVFFKEKISIPILIAAIVSLAGVCLLVGGDEQAMNIRGLISVGLTVFTYAIYIVSFSRSELKQLSPYVSMFYVMIAGSTLFAIISLLTTGITPIPNLSAGLNILGLALIVTTFSGLALIRAVQLAGSTITSVLGSFEPVVATVIGILYFKETFSWSILCGFILIISAVTYVVFVSNNPKKAMPKN